jgi:LacI family transcriptional regulator
LSPGKEISLMGYDGLELGAWVDPPLSTMTQPIQTVGKDLAEMLVNLVKDKKKPSSLQKLVRANILRRGTDNSPMTIS